MQLLVAVSLILTVVAANPQWVFNYDALGHPGGVAVFNHHAPTRQRAPQQYTSYQHPAPAGVIAYQRSVPQEQYEHEAPYPQYSYDRHQAGPYSQYSYDRPQTGGIEAARALAQAQDTSRGLPQIVPDTPEVQRAKARFAAAFEKAAILSAPKYSSY